MSVDDFRKIKKKSLGRCNQLVLGGREDPDQYEALEEICRSSVENQMVPSYITLEYMDFRKKSLTK